MNDPITCEIVALTKAEYDELIEDSYKLASLEGMGVDNWSGYDEAMADYRKSRKERRAALEDEGESVAPKDERDGGGCDHFRRGKPCGTRERDDAREMTHAALDDIGAPGDRSVPPWERIGRIAPLGQEDAT